MLAPAIIMLVLFSIYPFIVNLINATSHYNFTEPNNRYFVGLENFVDLLKDKIFWQALYQTLYYVFGSVFLEFFLGFGVAYLLLDNFKGRDVFRTLYILPLGATPIAISLVWKIMLNPDLGIIPYFLKIIGFGKLDLLGNIKTVIPSLIIVAGDSKGTEETESLLGDVPTVTVKWAVNEHSALCLPIEVTHNEIRKTAKESLERIAEFKPYALEPPYHIEVDFFLPEKAEKMEKLAGVARIDELTVQAQGDDLPLLWEEFIGFCQNYQ
jgi:hypothetical protein